MSAPRYVVRVGGVTAQGREFSGTGFFVDASGLIATCYHVAFPNYETPTELWVEPGPGRRWKCELRKANAAEDMAIIGTVVPLSDETPFARLDETWRDTRPGDEVTVWGFSAAEHYAEAQVFTCHVSGFAGEFARIGLNASINPGDSGAPVLNSAGMVIGVVSLKDQKREGQAMAIPVSYLMDLLPPAVRALHETPYRGLEYFDVEHSDFFFGRESLVQQLLGKLTTPENRFLGLVGTVGSGKSSLARAGLLAAIKRGALTGSAGWPIAICRPGKDPLKNLAIALAKAKLIDNTSSGHTTRVQELRASDTALDVMTRLGLSDTHSRAVVLVDQFEEVFTQCTDDVGRQAFIDNLTTAAAADEGQTIVLLTLRADFYGDCFTFPKLREALSAHHVPVGPMRNDELRSAIEEPARRAGAKFEPGLVDVLLDDVRGQPSSLPLLQYTLLELWKAPEDRLTHKAYQRIGKVGGALQNKAEQAYAGFDEPQRAALRRIMLRLVQSTETGKVTRRTVHREDLLPAEGDRASVEKVIDRMAGTEFRLLTIEDSGQVPDSAVGRETTRLKQRIDIAHEALIRSWERLGQWLDEDREFQLWQKRLNAGLAEWEQSGRHADALLRGKLLEEARGWLESRPADLNRIEREFISAGLNLQDAQAEVERTRQAELQQAQSQRLQAETERAEIQARSATTWKRLVSVLTLLFVAAAATAGFALHEVRVARSERAHALSLGLADASGDNLAGDPDLALVLAIHAITDRDTPEAEQALHQAIQKRTGSLFAAPAGQENHVVLGMAYNPESHLLAAANSDRSVVWWKVGDGTSPGTSIPMDTDVAGVAFRPGAGRELAVTATGGVLRILDLSGAAPAREIRAAGKQINAAAFNPSGDMLAIGTRDDAVPAAILTYPAGNIRRLQGHTGPVTAGVFSSDGKYLVTAGVDGTVIGWDPGPGQIKFRLAAKQSPQPLLNLAVNPAGTLIAAGDTGGSIHLWKPPVPDQIVEALHSRQRSVRALAFSTDGRTLASASQDGTLKIWDVSDSGIAERTTVPCGKPLAPEQTDREGCPALLFIDAHTLLAAGRDGEIRRFETDAQMLLAQARKLFQMNPPGPETNEGCRKYLRMPKCALP